MAISELVLPLPPASPQKRVYSAGSPKDRTPKRRQWQCEEVPSTPRRVSRRTPSSSPATPVASARRRSTSPPFQPHPGSGLVPQHPLVRAIARDEEDQVCRILKADPDAVIDAYLDGGLEPAICVAARCRASPAIFESLLQAGARASDNDSRENTAASLVSSMSSIAGQEDAHESWAIQVAEVLLRVGGLKPNDVSEASGRKPAEVAEAHGRKRLAAFWRYGAEIGGARVCWRAAVASPSGAFASLGRDLGEQILACLLPEEMLGAAAPELRRAVEQPRSDCFNPPRLPLAFDFYAEA